MSNTWILISTPLHMKRLWNRMRTSPSMTQAVSCWSQTFYFPGCVNPFHTNFKHYIPLAAKDLSISLGSKSPNIPLNVCKCSTEKTYSTRDIGTQTVRKCYSKSSILLPDYKKLSCRHRGLNPPRTFCAIIFQLLFQPYYLRSCFQDRILYTGI